MNKFELIPYRLYLSQSPTWMHRIKAEVKVCVLLLFWISIFALSYYKLLVLIFCLIIASFTVKRNRSFILKQFFNTLIMTIVTMLFSLGVAMNYKSYLREKRLHTVSLSDNKELVNSNSNFIIDFKDLKNQQQFYIFKPVMYFFITVYSIKLIMITTSPEILAITIYNTKIVNKVFNNELIFMFLLSSHIITNIVVKLEKISQVVKLRGRLNLYIQVQRYCTLLVLLLRVFFLETIKESHELSRALFIRQLNQENNNFLKVYQDKVTLNDYLGLFGGSAYLAILFLM